RGPNPARLIVNEVAGTDPSLLRGALEVAGPGAGVVVANPNGITCDGCGFINTPRATLSTGTPQWGAQGQLEQLDTRQGVLTVGPGGLNAADVAQLDLIARGIVLAGPMWTDNVRAVIGANQVLYDYLH